MAQFVCGIVHYINALNQSAITQNTAYDAKIIIMVSTTKQTTFNLEWYLNEFALEEDSQILNERSAYSAEAHT